MIDHDNLEAFADAEAYDIADPTDTGGAFYRALAQEAGGPVLEIGCGTGRITIPIARMDVPVTGLDIVPGMIERAQRKSVGLPAKWVVGDGRSFRLDEQFHLIFLTGNVFQFFLTNADQAALLERVHAHLHPDGLFAFETRNPGWPGLTTRPEPYEGAFFYLETWREERASESYRDAEGRSVQVSSMQTYDHVAQILHLRSDKRWRESGQEQTQVTRTALRYTFPQELAALLHSHDFTIIRQYGDWNYEPLTEASPSIIVVCRQ
ncbi:MAG: class I SAM-dependent methyltransferase [Caldilineaceae bacterium]